MIVGISMILAPINVAAFKYTPVHLRGAAFQQQTGDPAASSLLTWRTLADHRQQPAQSMADFDIFWLFAVLALALVLLVPFMKRSVAGKGAHLAAD
jgi:DHA2 family multidrug resistance protein